MTASWIPKLPLILNQNILITNKYNAEVQQIVEESTVKSLNYDQMCKGRISKGLDYLK